MIINKLVFSRLIGLGLSIATLGGVVMLEPEARAETQPIWYNCLTREVFTPKRKFGAIAGKLYKMLLTRCLQILILTLNTGL